MSKKEKKNSEKVNKVPAIVLGVPGYLLNVFWN